MPARVGRAADEEGSILPLLLGYAILAIALIFVCVCATDLYIAQKRLETLADAAALAGADGFVLVADGDGVRAVLRDEEVAAQARELVASTRGSAELVRADAPDGVTARVTVTATWHPPLVSSFVPDGLRLAATATSRTALR